MELHNILGGITLAHLETLRRDTRNVDEQRRIYGPTMQSSYLRRGMAVPIWRPRLQGSPVRLFKPWR